MKKYLVISGLIVGIFLSIQLSIAEDNPGEDVDDTLEYTYGSVVSVSPAQVIINEYNYESDEEVKVPYVLDAQTKFSNLAGVQDLAKDDNVDIYYKVTGDQRVASMVTKDETVYENEENADAGEDEIMNEQSNESINPPVSPPIENTTSVNDTRG